MKLKSLPYLNKNLRKGGNKKTSRILINSNLRKILLELKSGGSDYVFPSSDIASLILDRIP